MFNVFSVSAVASTVTAAHSSDIAACNRACSTLLTGFSSFMLSGILTGEKILNELSGLDYIQSPNACVCQ